MVFTQGRYNLSQESVLSLLCHKYCIISCSYYDNIRSLDAGLTVGVTRKERHLIRTVRGKVAKFQCHLRKANISATVKPLHWLGFVVYGIVFQ
jgi:hypothetical protein